ncbi:flagellin [Salipiger mangrovisoli]|uniref:Flagellar biosynthesis protein FlgL n=1 Tax=Salipiger mangrovisoli TaxID=2865933 RepID=A0ABR9WXG3_9RHOB|nr:flagellin [Salipiger mangrovisoli]MBE9635921.1 flagellar biosynthesis protein FlgL [Salipiger mangrovisoli]
MDTVGDLARSLVLGTHHTRLNRELDKLGVEIATGFVRDPARHLQGDVTGLVALDRDLSRLEAFRISTTEASARAATMQTTLEEIQSRAELLSQVLLSAELTPTQEMRDTFSEEARNAMGQVLAGLNRNIGGRFLFSGTANDTPAVAGLDDMLADLGLALSGQTTASDIDTALDAWFDSSGGGFETTGYLGSTEDPSPIRIGSGEQVALAVRGDDPVFRALLKSVAKAALATDVSLGLAPEVQTELLSQAGRELLGHQQGLVELRAGLGAKEARIEEVTARNAAERTALSMTRVDLVGADSFEAAARYENVRAQLESLYAITARSSQLSLVDFL